MQLDEYVSQVADGVRSAAALGDDRTREIANGLALATASAVRLALQRAIADAAGEINAALLDEPGAPTVSARLVDADVALDVRPGNTHAEDEPAAARPSEDDATARISLRLADSTKSQIDAAAAREGVSVNTWLVRAAQASLASTRPAQPARQAGANRRAADPRRVTGWIHG